MTPERVKLYAAAARRCVPITIGDLDALDVAIERAIRQAVNEALEDAAKLAKARYFREYAGADSAFMEGRYDAAGEIYNAIRALKLPEEP